MQLPDENIEYDYRRLVAPPPDPWTPLTGLQAQNYVPPGRLEARKKPAKLRIGRPRMYFEGNNLDNDALADLLDLLEVTCVEPDVAEERWGAIVVSKSGGTLETAAAYRALRAEAAKYYGPKSPWLKQ